MNNLANVKTKEGDLAGALTDYIAAAAINQRTGNKDWLGNNYDNIGTVYLRLSDHPKALDYMLKALALRERIGDKPGIATSYSNLGIFYQQQSDLKEALRYTQAALKTREEMDDPNGMAISHVNIANILNGSGQHAAALKEAQEAMRIAGEIGAQYTLIAAYAYAGQAYEAMARYDEALRAYERGAHWRSGSTTGAMRPSFPSWPWQCSPGPSNTPHRAATWVPRSRWRARWEAGKCCRRHTANWNGWTASTAMEWRLPEPPYARAVPRQHLQRIQHGGEHPAAHAIHLR
jgi:tetratricopeptide (TPR) repeat protein